MSEYDVPNGQTRGLPRRRIQRYCWLSDGPGQRDHLFSAPLRQLGTLPAEVDLTLGMPDVYDQGNLGSCTPNVIGAAFQFGLAEQGLPDLMPSRLFIYYNERVILGPVNFDSGARLRDGIRSVAQLGVCSEDLWPCDTSKFRDEPSEKCYQEAAGNRALDYHAATGA